MAREASKSGAGLALLAVQLASFLVRPVVWDAHHRFAPECRWNASRDERGAWHYKGWQQAVAAVEAAVRQQGPFDGLMGFSQVCAPLGVWHALACFVPAAAAG